jgi:predicted transcriptional regulator
MMVAIPVLTGDELSVVEHSVVIDGAQLRKWRTRYRLSQRELGHAIGYSQQVVSDWERGKRTIPVNSYLPIVDCILTARRAWADLYGRFSELR